MMRAVYGWQASRSTKALLIQFVAAVSLVSLPVLTLAPSASAQAGSTPQTPATAPVTPTVTTPPPVFTAPAQPVTYPPPAAAPAVTPAQPTATAPASTPTVTSATTVTTAVAPAATTPATATSTSAAVGGDAASTLAVTGPDESALGNEGKLDWDRGHRRYATWYGPSGGLFLFDGRQAVPGAIRVQLGLDGFAADDFLNRGDHVELSTQTLVLNGSITSWLEIYGSLANRSAQLTKPEPSRSLDTLGDISLGGRVGTPLGKLFDLGGDLRASITNMTGGGGFEWGATSVALRAALSMDLEKLDNPIPLLFRLNIGYLLDNSSVVVKDTENARYDNLSNPADKADETAHLVSRFERFAMNVNRMDKIVAGLGVELPLKVAEKFYLHPMLEWQIGLPINRQGYDCAYVVDTPDIGTYKSPVDSCYERNVSSMPMNLGFGVRVVPPVRGLSAVLGVDIGLMGATTFVRDLAPNTPWRLLVALSYDYDARPTPRGTTYIPVEAGEGEEGVAAPAPLTGRVQGSVALADGRAVANARVRYVGAQLTDMITGDDGHFVTEPMPPGPVTLDIIHPDYDGTRCAATIPPRGGDVPLLCTVKARPVVGKVNGQVLEGAGMPVPGARVIVNGPLNNLLLTDAQGNFALDELPPGSYQLRVEAGGYFIQLAPFTIEGRVTIPLSISLRRKPIAPTISFVGDAVEAPTIQYATDTATVPLATSQAAISEVADLLLSRPDLYLQILGFGPTNEIGLARAQVLKQKLIEAGVPTAHVEAAGGGVHKLRLMLHR